ncbi:Immune inhibitor A peptidase M6 [Bacillus sp. THAF10]|uniref:FixG Ig-like domain-containing protein n=1 Tax=Bacillus sp. THAF10 TaxID=2587848 RepID=UPI001267C8AC|nr:FixG Ig-like domain-containing protein [Bacillus sp. THAF10]QFT87780.1 Immune inhibitor A peptidase M6 [Bacillus sp. THAF10]
MNRKVIFFIIFAVSISSIVYFGMNLSGKVDSEALSDFPYPDQSTWTLPKDMTWEDYRGIPNVNWNEMDDVKPERELKGALILVDFPDREFILTQPEGTDFAGNPVGVDAIKREDLPEWWVNFLNKPQELNNFRTINEYWRENSFGKWAVDLEAFGVYRMDHHEFQYGFNEFEQLESMPEGYEPRELIEDVMDAAEADLKKSGKEFDFTFIVYAGYSESGIWREFGMKRFAAPEEIPAELGPPAELENVPNWAISRYVPWTSYRAAASIWDKAYINEKISVQAEASGLATFAHEFGHIMDLGDNYNLPHADPVSRSFSGPWELMDTGSFNGPGGQNSRWHVPATLGSSSPSHHMLRNKIIQGFLKEDQYIFAYSNDLKESGPLFTDVLTRSVPAGPEFGREGIYGLKIGIMDRTPRNYLIDDHRADMQNGSLWYNHYTLEVVDRVGFDSFLMDAGVLLAKTKTDEAWPNIWVIDSQPEDINEVDYVDANGEEVMVSLGDYQQLADALFKAGTAEGVVNEYVDPHNQLHFYILEKKVAEDGVLSYRVAVRNLEGAGPYKRGLSLEKGKMLTPKKSSIATHFVKVTNEGEATDIFRLEASTDSSLEVVLVNNLIEVEAGETVEVPVYIRVPEEKTKATIQFKVSSETDEGQKQELDLEVEVGG